MTFDGYSAYAQRMAVKQHFTTTKYDYLKYAGKWKDQRESFEKRSDKSFYYVLANRYKKEIRDFYVSVYCRSGNESVWGVDFLMQELHTEYVKWKRRNQALKHHFIIDLNTIKDCTVALDISFKDALLPKNGKLPVVMQLENSHIGPETLVILNLLTNFLDKDWGDVWDEEKLRIRKLRTFVKLPELSSKIYAKILREFAFSNDTC